MERLSSRERLIQTTAQLLQEKGYYGTGLKDILKLSGTPSGSLYHYFPDGKEELTAAAIRSAGRRLEKQIETTIENHPDLYRALQEITSRLSQELIDSDFQKGCSSIYLKWQNLLSTFLQRSEMKEDQVKPVSILLLAVIEGALVLCRANRSIEPLEIVSKQLENILNILT
ncbi:TetR/AcrR family transcriptional regulator [Leptospira borgpetersenii serovar Hardjo-bovis]|uniref:Transcriptional regulator, TetR family n=1 Tax=Leptospira borgpetersenii serovar Hardjo-bovis str. Sponselee TaxID=1303729 RepID=M6BKN5_LEPBO|nr:TetR/AcrR family transcriptional regulator [Leptospira borgpetersenii]ABJ80151.1 Transcriptional regulator, AcrR-family [Leptospira borgpetersenii serovar Hardjo-bovis str. L550]AMX59614.1 AcrR family transcriptional regulator [Leptospira borgpetersenii serovar Hardjo]AMX62842.1 AcrR family transcriptional regulator [Leptospira borgpetersenii serovar Hardjo]AMX66085.1 AcrR family transcriptional regulator [Leptospira borgpetersenii serovar Hardjo]AMX69317.1 AcrR family transcriptional regul